MGFESSMPFILVSGAALITLLTYPTWPRIEIKSQSQSLRGTRVRDIALSISWMKRSGARSVRRGKPTLECSIYIILKRRNA